jgi:hypothetical protein
MGNLPSLPRRMKPESSALAVIEAPIGVSKVIRWPRGGRRLLKLGGGGGEGAFWPRAHGSVCVLQDNRATALLNQLLPFLDTEPASQSSIDAKEPNHILSTASG